MKCHGCGLDAQPVIGLLPSGQFGQQCGRCQNPLGVAMTPPSSFLAREDADKTRHAPVEYMSPTLEIATPSPPRHTNGHAKAKHLTGPVQARVHAEPEADDRGAEEILRTRIRSAESEIAQLEIQHARLNGLRVEVKSLRKMLAATEAAERAQAPAAVVAPQADLFAKN